jgi:hypothetical protein
LDREAFDKYFPSKNALEINVPKNALLAVSEARVLKIQ